MSQNRSSAVMQQRREPADSLDFFPTPPWATRALVEHVLIPQGWSAKLLANQIAWDPACGEGDMLRALRPYFLAARGSDVHPYGCLGQEGTYDFLMPEAWPPSSYGPDVDWIITNPPFRLAEQFLQVALRTARVGVAMLLRLAFVEGIARWKAVYRDVSTRPLLVAPFVERVAMVKGRLDEDASSATAYCWLVWQTDGGRTSLETRMVWIPPCRKTLERPDDYPEAA